MPVQLGLAISPVVHSQMWPMTTALDSAAPDTAISFFIFLDNEAAKAIENHIVNLF